MEKCNFKTHMVLMKGITWSRDSHGLFDYESRHLTKRTMKTTQPIQIVRQQNDLQLLGFDQLENQEENKPLLNIINENEQFYLESCTEQLTKVESKDLNEQMFLVVRSLKHNNQKIDYEIQYNDILKVGRVKFAVKEIRQNNQLMTNCEQEFEEYEEVMGLMRDLEECSNEDEQKRCRFCWQTNASKDNPLFQSCKCSGSVGFIHFDCLRNWLDIKKQMKNSANFTSYYWKSFECEICKKPYPLIIRSEGMTYNLVDYERPQGNYLVLESLNQEKNTSRIIHIIRPDEEKDAFKLGRGHESDLRINDISVSRCHAIVKFKDNKFFLEDNLSKFGTLVLVKQKTELVPCFNKAVQVGRTVINFSVKPANQPRNFGPRPNDCLISEKFKHEGNNQQISEGQKDNGQFENSFNQLQISGNQQINQEQGVKEQNNDEMNFEDIPDELPRNNKEIQ